MQCTYCTGSGVSRHYYTLFLCYEVTYILRTFSFITITYYKMFCVYTFVNELFLHVAYLSQITAGTYRYRWHTCFYKTLLSCAVDLPIWYLINYVLVY